MSGSVGVLRIQVAEHMRGDAAHAGIGVGQRLARGDHAPMRSARVQPEWFRAARARRRRRAAVLHGAPSPARVGYARRTPIIATVAITALASPTPKSIVGQSDVPTSAITPASTVPTCVGPPYRNARV